MIDNQRRCGSHWIANGANALLAWPSYFYWFLFFLALFPISQSFAQTDQPVTDPKLLSIFPLGGRQGTIVQGEVWGNFLEGSNAIWFDVDGLSGKLLAVEEVKGQVRDAFFFNKKQEKPLPLYRAQIEIKIQPEATMGVHHLRLVGLRGISDAVPFRVTNERVLQEPTSPHLTLKGALPFDLPAIINGRLEKPGELDYYSFQAKQGQELSFELILAQNCNPQLALYRAGGSWFDSDRPTRLIAQEQKSSDLMSVDASETYRLPQDGTYFLEISSLFGRGSPGSTYQVRVASSKRDSLYEGQSRQPAGDWPERKFSRELDGNWMASLEARSLDKGEGSGGGDGRRAGSERPRQRRPRT